MHNGVGDSLLTGNYVSAVIPTPTNFGASVEPLAAWTASEVFLAPSFKRQRWLSCDISASVIVLTPIWRKYADDWA